MTEQIEDKLKQLESFETKFFDLAKKMFEPGKTYIYPLDLMTNAIMDRSLSLIFGFTSQIRSNNYLCAAPLVRLHLDNLLRLYAGYIVKDPHEFAMKVLKGQHVRNMIDQNGNKMTDKYLVDQLTKEYKWIQNVYKETSGFVHFSNKHIFSSSEITNEKGGILHFSISKEDRFVSDDSKLEAINCMIEISEILFDFLYGWTYTKRDGDMSDNKNDSNSLKT